MTRKKGGGRESGASGETEAVRAAETGRTAANPAARIRELEERIALMEQATCDFCGHAFYALEADG